MVKGSIALETVNVGDFFSSLQNMLPGQTTAHYGFGHFLCNKASFFFCRNSNHIFVLFL